ncbi:uncharacterized protein with FMN-binding domain [Psychromicrobium silvestre]|uniref:Uncharacterized protein with FMN-binding domain n=1 Tax=Psychromicrobium silvestre TaxID=1645614 RepID=A0A7Y9LUR0_9MICC|nr:FMN-binding protein [Psychromicrobium silvestre]NYE95895.1 uncharacterized protein with FMN-binding domain [Psychromicrobium silvestre]
MRRVIITITATIAGLILLLSFKTHPMAQAGGTTSSTSATTSAPQSVATAPVTPSSGTTSSTTSPTATADATTGSSATTSKTYAGTAIDTRYGPVQVQITVVGTKITDVTALQVPSENGRDQQINSYAVPQLTQEVLAAQSANVDMISGGTYTSEGYLQSLQSALDQAGIK